MKNAVLLYIAALVMSIFCYEAMGYSADFILQNETGSSALIKLPGVDNFVKIRGYAQLPLWQLNLSSNGGITVKFKGEAIHVLSNKTFIIKPDESATWGDIPKGRIVLHRGEPILATLYYDNEQGEAVTTELQVFPK